MVPPDLESRAAREAQDLGHRRIGSEHLLLALLGSESVGPRALEACGLTREQVLEAIRGLPEGYHRRITRRGTPSGSLLVYDPDVATIRARAEGLAAGSAGAKVLDEHVLLAMLWEPGPTHAVRLLGELDVTRERVSVELGRLRGGVPRFPLPYLPSWGEPFFVSREEFGRLAADLKRRGVLYRANTKGDQMIVSIDEGGKKRGPRPSGNE
jgi:hypothetical protein